MGFSGAYLSTFISSYFTLAATLILLDKRISLASMFELPSKDWIIKFLKCATFELVRLISWQLLIFSTLVFFASNVSWIPRLGAYAVANELYLVVTMPFIAVILAFN
jgi:Na+-driven multidrug efflux pump